jgi:hypothetical protein
VTAPIDLAKARRLIEADGRMRLGLIFGDVAIAVADGDVLTVRRDGVRLRGANGDLAQAWVVDLGLRIERECRAWDEAGMRRLWQALVVWSACEAALDVAANYCDDCSGAIYRAFGRE